MANIGKAVGEQNVCCLLAPYAMVAVDDNRGVGVELV